MQARQVPRAGWISTTGDDDQFGAVKGTLASVILGVAVWAVIILAILRTIR
jgi:hypothetical protein